MDDDATRAGSSADGTGRSDPEADGPERTATAPATVWVVEPDDEGAGRDADSSGRDGDGVGRRAAADCEHAPGDLRHVGDDGVNSYYQCTRCGSVLVAQNEVVRAARESGESRDPRGRTG